MVVDYLLVLPSFSQQLDVKTPRSYHASFGKGDEWILLTVKKNQKGLCVNRKRQEESFLYEHLKN